LVHFQDVGIGQQLVQQLIESCGKLLSMSLTNGMEFREPLKTVKEVVMMLSAFHVYTS
jgi:hypothetical protein